MNQGCIDHAFSPQTPVLTFTPETPATPLKLTYEDRRAAYPQPAIVQHPDHVALGYRDKLGQIVAVLVDDMTDARRLANIPSWRLYPNRPGEERYLRRQIRIGGSVTTEYAHDFLFGKMDEDGTKVQIRPQDGNYLNLRAGNFGQPKPRSAEEVERLLMLLDGDVFTQLQSKAMRALWDKAKADAALGDTFDHVAAYLAAGKGKFENDQKFRSWVFVTLERHIRKHMVSSDVILEKPEFETRSMFDVTEMTDWSAGKNPETGDEVTSDTRRSSLRTQWEDDLPALSACLPLPKVDRSADDEA